MVLYAQSNFDILVLEQQRARKDTEMHNIINHLENNIDNRSTIFLATAEKASYELEYTNRNDWQKLWIYTSSYRFVSVLEIDLTKQAKWNAERLADWATTTIKEYEAK